MSLDDGYGLNPREEALVRLGCVLRDCGYRFVTPTPETHRRVNARPEAAQARTLRDVFGWTRPFPASLLPPPLLELCSRAQILVPATSAEPPAGVRQLWSSAVRYSTLSTPDSSLLLVHSAFPTTAADAVFFGPDSYRFAGLLTRCVREARRVVDVGCGTGVGGLVIARRAAQVVFADVNPLALRMTAVNAALAGVEAARVALVASDVLGQVTGEIDLVIANPPYIVDTPGRLYRDGGGALGIELALEIVDQSLARLRPGGQLVLYTGTPIIEGDNVLQHQVLPLLRKRAASWVWEELDPDVFGEELDGAPYRQTDRLAVVALVATVA